MAPVLKISRAASIGTKRMAPVLKISRAIRLVEEECMGKGDQRTRKGKIYRGSHGKTRPGRADGKKKK